MTMKTVLVTGGNRGIGFEICRQLDERGCTVILGSRDLEKGQETTRYLSNKVVVKQLDVTDQESVFNLYNSLLVEFGKLDVLINNAGIGEKKETHENSLLAGIKNTLETNIPGVRQMIKFSTPLLKKSGIAPHLHGAGDTSLTHVKEIMETNFYGPWRMMQTFIPLLQKSRDGRIINISSGMGELKSLTGFYPGYSLSKSSLNALTIMFSNELKNRGVSVNAMCPGWVKTDMGGPNAPLDVSEGADTAVWLATEKEIPTGNFFKERKIINW